MEEKDFMQILIKDFLSVRSLITFGAFATVYILTWRGKIPPEVVTRIVDLLLGYWFGEKVAKAVTQINGGTK
jgi:hypothetical protein